MQSARPSPSLSTPSRHASSTQSPDEAQAESAQSRSPSSSSSTPFSQASPGSIHSAKAPPVLGRLWATRTYSFPASAANTSRVTPPEASSMQASSLASGAQPSRRASVTSLTPSARISSSPELAAVNAYTRSGPAPPQLIGTVCSEPE